VGEVERADVHRESVLGALWLAAAAVNQRLPFKKKTNAGAGSQVRGLGHFTRFERSTSGETRQPVTRRTVARNLFLTGRMRCAYSRTRR
jgi:hypothetical protein